MKYFMAITVLLFFTASNTFASGGPPFNQLNNLDQKQKPTIKLISEDSKQTYKQKICLRNIAQNKVEKKPC